MRRPPSPILGPKARARLLTHAAASLRGHAVYTLALEAGLRCSEIAALDVGDVSADGRRPRDVFEVHRQDGRARAREQGRVVTLSPLANSAVGAYVTWRRSLCAHPDLPMKIGRGRDGVLRCASCGDVADFLRAPLFLGRGKRRLTANSLRAEFEGLRASLRLGDRVHFDSLHATYVSSRPAPAQAT